MKSRVCVRINFKDVALFKKSRGMILNRVFRMPYGYLHHIKEYTGMGPARWPSS